MEVIGKDGTLYSMSKRKGTKYDRIYKASANEAMSEWKRVEERLRPSYQNRFLFETSSNSKQLWKEETHEVMKSVATRFEFDYIRKEGIYKEFIGLTFKMKVSANRKDGFLLDDSDINTPPYYKRKKKSIGMGTILKKEGLC